MLIDGEPPDRRSAIMLIGETTEAPETGICPNRPDLGKLG
jgi:hypothetical protein